MKFSMSLVQFVYLICFRHVSLLQLQCVQSVKIARLRSDILHAARAAICGCESTNSMYWSDPQVSSFCVKKSARISHWVQRVVVYDCNADSAPHSHHFVRSLHSLSTAIHLIALCMRKLHVEREYTCSWSWGCGWDSTQHNIAIPTEWCHKPTSHCVLSTPAQVVSLFQMEFIIATSRRFLLRVFLCGSHLVSCFIVCTPVYRTEREQTTMDDVFVHSHVTTERAKA